MTNIHNACAKNVLKILEIEVHTRKLIVLVDCVLVLIGIPGFQRLFLEAWHSNKDKNSTNEHVEFPRVYLNVKNL